MANLKTFDINLLVVLEALLAEQHVTRAARRLGVTQPAMTSALNRLRGTFGDPLLIRSPAGMVPTPKALELLGPVRLVLRELERIFEHEHPFEASNSSRTFRVRMSDLLAAILLPDFASLVRAQAPRIRLEIVSLAPECIVPALESGDLDLAFSMGLEHGSAIVEERLLIDQFVLLRRASDATARDGLSAEGFRNLVHFKVAHGRFDTIFTDAILKELGAEQSVALQAVNWLAAGPILEATDLVLVMSKRFAELTAKRYAVEILALPIQTPSIAWCAYWHRRDAADQALAWLRDLVEQYCAELEIRSAQHSCASL